MNGILGRLPLWGLSLLLMIFFFCELPEDPRNINNAGIERQTLTALPDKVPMNSVYVCTLQIRYPEFIDSFSVVKSKVKGSDEKITGSVIGDDTVFIFSLFLPDPGEYVIKIYIHKKGMKDSVTHSVTVFSTIPVVTAVKTKVFAHIGDDTTAIKFDVSDPDSNLLGYSLMQGNTVIEQKEFSARERAKAAIVKVFPASSLIGLRDTFIRFSAVAADLDSQKSAAALCTLFVRDSIPPFVRFLPPYDDTVYKVLKLPDTLRAVAADNWAIDSVKFGKNRALFVATDTVAVVINQLDSGITIDSMEAWDIAGNRAAAKIKLRYSGPKIYPPEIDMVYKRVNEGERFDTVYLDKIVKITNPEPFYGKESLKWSISVNSADSGMVIKFDSLSRTLVVEGPAGELFRDRIAVLSLTVTDPDGVSATLHGATFLMVEKDDKPIITIKGQGKIWGTLFDTLKLDTCGYDPEMNAQLVWDIQRGKYFYDSLLYVFKCSDKGGKEIGDPFLPICFNVFTGKVLILPDTAALASVPPSQKVIADTLLFTLKSITAGDTVESKKNVVFTWGKAEIIPPIEIPQLILP